MGGGHIKEARGEVDIHTQVIHSGAHARKLELRFKAGEGELTRKLRQIDLLQEWKWRHDKRILALPYRLLSSQMDLYYISFCLFQAGLSCWLELIAGRPLGLGRSLALTI